ncbi:hypothetical protein BEN30_07050 [Magnetovibrio blakemorei]|uniref:Methyltransferase domain-containing protein n=1 Tax=Magnetovibrio blakemorei TaxID=28181 RepID=A0A1E5Q983_9PROT|nr:hypothetical protein BEN30_07050 [Magnetovibrio blakemorei]
MASGKSALQRTLNTAIQQHQAGDLRAAKTSYEQILKADPTHPAALHLLGVLAHQMGKGEIAIELISKAIHHMPGVCEMHFNLGYALKGAGKLEDALTQYRLAINLKPDYVEAVYHLGLVLHELGQWAIAEEAFQNLLKLKPDSPNAHFVLGNLFKEQGRFADATVAYQSAIAHKPDMFEAYANLALAMQKQGRPDEAVALFQKALMLAPDEAQLHYNLGNALQDARRIEEAVASYRQALSMAPNLVGAHFNLARSLEHLGDANAFRHFWQAVVLDADNDLYWAAFANSVMGLELTAADADFLTTLDVLLNRPNVRPRDLAHTIINALKCQPDFWAIVQKVLNSNSDDDVAFETVAKHFSEFPVFMRLMRLSPLTDLGVERMLTRLRHALLRHVLSGELSAQGLAFAAAMAQQSFANEFVLCETAAESDQVEALHRQIAQTIEDGQNPDSHQILALATYRPLHGYAWAEKLVDGVWPDVVREVIRCQIEEPLQERVFRGCMPCLAPIDGDVSQAVRDQYEQNPYPRWLKTAVQNRTLDFSQSIQSLQFWREPEPFCAAAPPQVLIAGCGTGQQSVNTASWLPDAQVLAVDLSLSSLSYAWRKTNELGISNIEYAQADILALGNLKRSFDLVESVGVLHHMEDPVQGWKVLVDVLRPGGFMKIGLYSELARQSVVQARALIADQGYASTPQDIRRLREDLVAMGEAGNSELSKLFQLSDFYSLSECRDLLFHVQEHRFTLAQINEILQELNLTFLGFELRRESVRRQFERDHPQPGALQQLACWHDFETRHPDTFIGMYQFWCQKSSSGTARAEHIAFN